MRYWTEKALTALHNFKKQVELYEFYEVCAKLNVSVQRKSIISAGLLVSGKPIIILDINLCVNCSLFVGYHELAHFALRQANLPLPLGDDEYWTLEELCDNFARVMTQKLAEDDLCRPCRELFHNSPQMD